jgi:hypothetical protein
MAFAVVPIVLWSLCVARITGLITMDELTAPIRQRITQRFDARSRIQRACMYTIGGFDDHGHGCPWCVSVWVAAVTAPIIACWWQTTAVHWGVATLAVAQISGMTWTWGRQ